MVSFIGLDLAADVDQFGHVETKRPATDRRSSRSLVPAKISNAPVCRSGIISANLPGANRASGASGAKTSAAARADRQQQPSAQPHPTCQRVEPLARQLAGKSPARKSTKPPGRPLRNHTTGSAAARHPPAGPPRPASLWPVPSRASDRASAGPTITSSSCPAASGAGN